MKRVTHVVFSSGLVAYLSKLLGLSVWEAFVLALLAAFIQYVIDALSHEMVYTDKGTIVRRTPLLHSPTGATVISIAFTLVLAFMLKPTLHKLMIYLVLMLVASYSHLLLDVPTEKGIYVKGKRIWKERKFGVNNPLLNALFILIGLFLLYLAFQGYVIRIR